MCVKPEASDPEPVAVLEVSMAEESSDRAVAQAVATRAFHAVSQRVAKKNKICTSISRSDDGSISAQKRLPYKVRNP